jgi:4-hydroxybenzoyl-CoA thioesterase
MQETPKFSRAVVTRSERIYWGDCDPAGIIYYPRYFDIFDRCTTGVFEQALGMNKRELLKAYAFAGFPLVDIRARFLAPTRFGDDVIIETTTPDFRRSSFDLSHRLLKDGRVAVECSETRVWVIQDPSDAARIKATPVPLDVIERFARM